MSGYINHIAQEIHNEWELTIPPIITEDILIDILAQRIDLLIKNDLSKLIAILYRIDVDEHKLRTMLAQYPKADAGLVVATLVMERQKQKLKTKALFSKPAEDIDDAEKW